MSIWSSSQFISWETLWVISVKKTRYYILEWNVRICSHFHAKSQRLFFQKTPSQMFYWVLNTPLIPPSKIFSCHCVMLRIWFFKCYKIQHREINSAWKCIQQNYMNNLKWRIKFDFSESFNLLKNIQPTENVQPLKNVQPTKSIQQHEKHLT